MPFRNILALFLLCLAGSARAGDINQLFGDVELRIDTNLYTLRENQVTYRGQSHLAFQFSNPDPVCEITLKAMPGDTLQHVKLLSSGDYDLIDSLSGIDQETARFKVRFHDLINSDYLKFSFTNTAPTDADSEPVDLNLLPYTPTFLKLYTNNDELYIGEEKVFELLTDNMENIRISNDWVETEELNYRMRKNFNQIYLHVVPKSLGRHEIVVPVSVKKPILNDKGKVVFDLPNIRYTFFVKQSRLRFLNIDRSEVTLDDSTRMEGIEIQIENDRLLQLQKTYRIELQEEAGGSLIAELFTKSELTNDKVLCILRVYNYHRTSEGYLYIKDGDQARFITNFGITPETSIRSISVLRDGNWTRNLTVYPGEIIDLKIEGVALHKADFNFVQMEEMRSSDSLIRGERLAYYRFKVPMNVAVRRLELYNFANPTGHYLNVREYQEPRPFDFLSINYQGVRQSIDDLPSTVLVNGTIQNLILASDPDMIDSRDKLYGKQYMRLDITITGRRNELIEVKTIENVVICPGIKSPRAEHYNRSDCGPTIFDLNKYFRKKTSSLEIWSQIKVRVSHQKEKYGGEGFSQEFDIVLRKPTSFDVEVSFPAGLLTVSKQLNAEDRVGQLTGISVAMIGQFTFYHPEKINIQRPYKIGAGFLALNTFNFNANDADRDLGIVVLGSLYPTTRDVKLTFPLYFGGGYLLKRGSWFMLVGPGIRLRF